VVVLKRVVVRVCKIMRKHSNDGSRHQELFESTRPSLYKVRALCVGVLSFCHSLVVFLYSEASSDLELAMTLSLSSLDVFIRNLSTLSRNTKS